MAMSRAIGLMSGTSLDGVDVALIETDGETVHVVKSHNNFLEPLGPTGYRGYSEEEKALLLRAAPRTAEAIVQPADRPPVARGGDLRHRGPRGGGGAVPGRERLKPSDIDVIGFTARR